MGLTVLAGLIAGWRLHAGRLGSWTWTNVAGWVLGLYWVGMAFWSLLPARASGLFAR
jgi:hypothetical protein